MQSLKSGPPEVWFLSIPTAPLSEHHSHAQIDYEKLANFAGMGNPRSAGNAWAKLKGKLMDNAATPSTPKKPRKKATKGNVDEDGEATPKMTPASRKRVQKKQDVDGDASPKKKTRVVKCEYTMSCSLCIMLM